MCMPTLDHQSLSSSRPSRVSSTRRKPAAKTKASSTASSRSATPRPPPPPITLPDPDLPIPLNFLRNQQSLLGHAGLVGGVNPSSLSVKRAKPGSTARNPIVIDETFDGPLLGCRSQGVDPVQLPSPSNDDIVASLIKQKNIFPVLESLLKLINGSHPASESQGVEQGGLQQRSDNEEGLIGPAAKRRKLGNVPAGATDWDVPYPFVDGEGPQDYGVKWEKERTRQLITQLLGVIKTATLKAATKKYAENHKKDVPSAPKSMTKAKLDDIDQQPKVNGHYRPVTLTYGLDATQAQKILADNSNVRISDSQSSSSMSYCGDYVVENGKQPPSRFEQVISDLVYVQGASRSDVEGSDGVTSLPFDQDFDEGMFDNWLKLLQSCPAAEMIDNLTSMSIPDERSTNTRDSILGDADGHSSDRHLDAQLQPSLSNDLPLEQMMFPGFAIDPALLALSSMPIPLSSTPSLVASPMPSVSEFAEPLTPDLVAPLSNSVVAINQESIAEDPVVAASMLLDLASASSSSQKEQSFNATMTTPSICLEGSMAIVMSNAPSMTTHSAPSNHRTHGNNSDLAQSLPMLKVDILEKSKERRRQLAAEMERAKVELWEMTIEQGVLAQMAKDI